MRIGILMAAGLLIAASAGAAPYVDGITSTQNRVADPALSQARPSPFAPREDGGVDHPASLGQCPASIAGFQYRESTVFEDDGSDVGCQYNGDEGVSHMTVYFYQTIKYDTTEASALEAGDAILKRFEEAEYLEDESQSCSYTIDLMQWLDDVGQNGMPETDTEVIVGKAPCHVFRIAQGSTLVATDMVGPWHLKVRVTAASPDIAINDLVNRTSEIMRTERAWMSGKSATNLEELMRSSEDPPGNTN